jgi:hypothetical protein
MEVPSSRESVVARSSTSYLLSRPTVNICKTVRPKRLRRSDTTLSGTPALELELVEG